MNAALPFLLAGVMFTTVAVLFTGIISFAVGGRFSRVNATKLMALRVMLQGAALAIFALLVVLGTG